MLAVVWVILAILIAVLLTAWITFTLTRLDRLYARVDAAQASLDAQLVRRVAAVAHVVDASDATLSDVERHRYVELTQQALAASTQERQASENAVGRAVIELVESRADLTDEAAGELAEAATRVLIARRFYNDAVRDTRALKQSPLPRLLHLGPTRPIPQFFDIDDTVPVRR